jgi:hypothetical protein
VLTSKPPTRTPKGNVSFTFITDGIASALEQARAAAGVPNVAIGDIADPGEPAATLTRFQPAPACASRLPLPRRHEETAR